MAYNIAYRAGIPYPGQDKHNINLIMRIGHDKHNINLIMRTGHDKIWLDKSGGRFFPIFFFQFFFQFFFPIFYISITLCICTVQPEFLRVCFYDDIIQNFPLGLSRNLSVHLERNT